MMVDTTVYGYVADGGVACPDCYDPIDTGGEESASRIYSTDDTDAHGLFCDGCGEPIFEPDFEALWEEAIEDAIRRDGRSTWQAARAILGLFQEAGFDVKEARFPD